LQHKMTLLNIFHMVKAPGTMNIVEIILPANPINNFPKLLSFDCHTKKQEPRNAVNSAFLGSFVLFKLQTDSAEYKAKSLILSHF
ncbi:MAG: hypothetical protein KH204_10530, partial [[Eubacterium] rectale]|nr:hypothetical protein [Agathobacter rectalis]